MADYKRHSLARSILRGGLSLLCFCACTSQLPLIDSHTVDAGASAKNTSVALTLELSDATGELKAAQPIAWRPVFVEASGATGTPEAGTALTDDNGKLTISSLLPGVRYLFTTEWAGKTYQRWYRVPEPTESAALTPTWQWVLGDLSLSADSPQAPAFVPLQRQRLHYLPGAAVPFASALAVAKEHLTPQPLALDDLQPSSDVVWWVSGAFAVDERLLTSSALTAVVRFVEEGGVLVINGEWAGMHSALAQQTQALGQRFGLQVSGDTLAQTGATLTLDNVHRHWLTHKVESLGLARSGSVRVYDLSRSQELAFAGAAHYRIAALAEQHTVLASVAYGKGLIIAVGDSSLWSDGYFSAQDNRQLWENILSPPEEASLKVP